MPTLYYLEPDNTQQYQNLANNGQSEAIESDNVAYSIIPVRGKQYAAIAWPRGYKIDGEAYFETNLELQRKLLPLIKKSKGVITLLFPVNPKIVR